MDPYLQYFWTLPGVGGLAHLMKGRWKTEKDLKRNEKKKKETWTSWAEKGLKHIKAECGFGRFWASLQQLRSPAGRLKEADGRGLKYSRALSGWRRGGAHAAVALHVHSHPAFTPHIHSEATQGSDGRQWTEARECIGFRAPERDRTAFFQRWAAEATVEASGAFLQAARAANRWNLFLMLEC